MATRPKQAGTGQSATAARTSVSDRLRAWVANHREVAAKSFGELMQTWASSLMTWLVIGVALALPTLLFLLLTNIGDISGDWDGKPRISVYLADRIEATEADAVTAGIEQRPDVLSATFISAEAALAEFQAFSGFGDVLASLDSNPLPPLIEVTPMPMQTAELRLLVANLEGLDAVDRVSIDLAWIERLYALLTLGERFVLSLAVFLLLGVLLSIGNTIRLAIENRRSEIEVIKLVGGTDSFVRRPFLYLGFWYGLGGALLAWLMVQISLLFLSGPVDRLLRSYEEQFSLAGLGVGATLLLLSTGAALGMAGAALAVRRHLHLIEPQ